MRCHYSSRCRYWAAWFDAMRSSWIELRYRLATLWKRARCEARALGESVSMCSWAAHSFELFFCACRERSASAKSMAMSRRQCCTSMRCKRLISIFLPAAVSRGCRRRMCTCSRQLPRLHIHVSDDVIQTGHSLRSTLLVARPYADTQRSLLKYISLAKVHFTFSSPYLNFAARPSYIHLCCQLVAPRPWIRLERGREKKRSEICSLNEPKGKSSSNRL